MKSIYILKVYWDKKQILIIIIIIIIIINKINVTKTALFSLSRVPAYHRFNFNSQFLYELKHMVHLCKTVYEIFHFQFRLVFINFYIYFFQQKPWLVWLSNVIIPFKIKIIQKSLTVLLSDLWFLRCSKKFENSMIHAGVGAPQELTWRRTF